MRAFSLIGSALLNSLSLHDLSVILRLIANTYFIYFYCCVSFCDKLAVLEFSYPFCSTLFVFSV